MIVQAIALLDDLDKEINIYAMRVKVSLLPTRQRASPERCIIRNGTVGISRKWRRLSSTTLRMRRSSSRWVSSLYETDKDATQLLTIMSRLPNKCCHDRLRCHPPRRPRGDAEGGSRHLYGHGHLGIRHGAHKLAM